MRSGFRAPIVVVALAPLLGCPEVDSQYGSDEFGHDGIPSGALPTPEETSSGDGDSGLTSDDGAATGDDGSDGDTESGQGGGGGTDEDTSTDPTTAVGTTAVGSTGADATTGSTDAVTSNSGITTGADSGSCGGAVANYGPCLTNADCANAESPGSICDNSAGSIVSCTFNAGAGCPPLSASAKPGSWVGSALGSCYALCNVTSDCPYAQMSCYYGLCVWPAGTASPLACNP